MNVRIDRAPVDALGKDRGAAGTEPASWPRLLEGTELLGRFEGSGLREPPYLVRRRDGQIVQLSRVLYVLANDMDGRKLAATAESAGARLDLRITPEQIAHVAEHKLAPLGLVAHRDGSEPSLEPRPIPGTPGNQSSLRAPTRCERAKGARPGSSRSAHKPVRLEGRADA